MDSGSVLSTAVEVAIAIGGFAGIVIVLGPSRGHDWSASSRLLLSALLLMSIAVAAFGFLPQILGVAGVVDEVLWRVASSLHAVYLAGIIGYRVRQTVRLPSAERSVGLATRALIGTAPVGAVVLQLANAIWLQQAWPYLTAIVLMVLGSFAVFMVLLREVWVSA